MQNHMFMLLALIGMDPPTSLEGEAIRNEKVKLLRSIHISTPEEALTDTVRGQYREGIVGGKKFPGIGRNRTLIRIPRLKRTRQ